MSILFADADDFHPSSNKSKMSSGIPLTDEDREPWLDILKDMISRWDSEGTDAILACSALKKSYRNHLLSGLNQLTAHHSQNDVLRTGIFVFLKGSLECIHRRMSQRKDHFMPQALLQSQFKDLEEPDPEKENVITVNVSSSTDEIVKCIELKLQSFVKF
ncbi:probable gluconokinase isoform X2 [Rhopilema esculentum]